MATRTARGVRSAQMGAVRQTGRPAHATTVFDLVTLPAAGGTGAGIVQAMPPRAYDLYIDDALYSVIGIEGLSESDYLRALLADAAATRSPSPVSIELACGTGGARPGPRVRDSAFLLLAYGITSTTALDADEQLCLFDIALGYGLPLAFADWLAVLAATSPADGLPGKVPDVASLCRVVDVIGNDLEAALALGPGLTPRTVARALGRCALGAMLRTPGGDTPESMTAVLLTLAAAHGPVGLGYEAARDWKRALVAAFGEAYAADRVRTNPLGALPDALTASHMVLMADPAISGQGDSVPDAVGYGGNGAAVESAAGRDGRACVASVSDADAHAVEERVRRFYADKRAAISGRAREAVTALVGRWLAMPTGAGAGLTVTYASPDPAFADGRLVYRDVRYDMAITGARASTGAGEGDAYYSYVGEPRPAAEAAATVRVDAPLRDILGGPWTRLDVRLTPGNLAAAGLSTADCARPDVVLPAVGWPLPTGASPFDPTTCTVSVDVGTVVDLVTTDPFLRSSLASATAP
ncbi:hypothetical protein pneo_cds_114 [Pandoravirus neocaledonia]|uniref:Uncharacterized protein n=1 Tax=Pandoravirus neocaledonia TaxID=2107708 RepID=A0A2U7UB84_9VIRU|nr:hypothetical protein pneo_cds_114 [Pandoravirus neocaledonia]AVK75721.1 hypothetical protein pneo_cds_114 [Pandoravirus neocaledonia]